MEEQEVEEEGYTKTERVSELNIVYTECIVYVFLKILSISPLVAFLFCIVIIVIGV